MWRRPSKNRRIVQRGLGVNGVLSDDVCFLISNNHKLTQLGPIQNSAAEASGSNVVWSGLIGVLFKEER